MWMPEDGATHQKPRCDAESTQAAGMLGVSGIHHVEQQTPTFSTLAITIKTVATKRLTRIMNLNSRLMTTCLQHTCRWCIERAH